VRGDIAIGVPRQACGLSRPIQTSEPQRATLLERVDVNTDANAKRSTRGWGAALAH
jgi:hypothetical protein